MQRNKINPAETLPANPLRKLQREIFFTKW